MKFRFIISKWGNFYFFIQNLSEWHFSCRKKYNALWQKELGSLSLEEKQTLKVFKKIRSKYKPAKTCFEQAFFSVKNPWQLLTTTLNPTEYQNIRKIFITFQNKFEKFYHKEYPLLEQWQKLLEKTANKKILNQKITKILDNLYKTKFTNKNITINVYLLPSTPDTTGGGANIDEKNISLEISRYPTKKNNHALAILWHETIHLIFEKQYFYPLISQKYGYLQKDKIFINEITAASLFPKGILGQELLKNKPGPLYFGKFHRQKGKFFRIMKSYITQKKNLDTHYIENILFIINK